MSGDTSKTDARVAIITGAGSGIGKATAILLARAGWHCALLGRTESKLASTALELDSSSASLTIECDLGRADQMPRIVQTVRDHFGRIDAILNIAGVAPQAPDRGYRCDPHAIDPRSESGRSDDSGRQRPGRELVKRRGVVVNVSSMSSIDPFHHFTAYAASKSGLDSLTRSIMAESGRQRSPGVHPEPGGGRDAAAAEPGRRDDVPDRPGAHPRMPIAEEILRLHRWPRETIAIGRAFPDVPRARRPTQIARDDQPRRRIARSMSRCASRLAMSCRLSDFFRPSATPIKTLARPSTKIDLRSGTSVELSRVLSTSELQNLLACGRAESRGLTGSMLAMRARRRILTPRAPPEGTSDGGSVVARIQPSARLA